MFEQDAITAATQRLICLGAILFLHPVAVAAGKDDPAAQTQYIRRAVVSKVARNWTPIRTAQVQPITLTWKIHKNGTVSDVRVFNSEVAAVAQQRAIEAVHKSAPFDPLPPGSPDSMDVKVQFETTSALKLTVAQALAHYGPSARKILDQKCQAAGIAYPPKRIALLGLKQEKQLLLFAGADQASLKLLDSYPLVSYSGVLGPKLKQGDLQIPEGIYGITGFQSYNMLSLCVNYPNDLDRKNAASDHRTNLGGDILVHGGSKSTGCLVVSNEDMEQLFVAVHDVGCKSTELIIAPCDLTKGEATIDLKKQPKWLAGLYKTIRARMIPLLGASTL